MNPEYKSLREVADRLYHRLNDVVDDRTAAGGLLTNAYNITEAFEMNKNPHSIETSVKALAENFRELRREGNGILDPRHADELFDGYEALREQIRELSNY